MGKNQDDRSLSPLPTSSPERINGGVRCLSIRRILSLRCVAAVAVGVAVLLSAIFWLPPFLGHGDRGGSDPQYGGEKLKRKWSVQAPEAITAKMNVALGSEEVIEVTLEPASSGSPLQLTDVVASFRLPKPVSLLNGNIEMLRYDIFDEIGVLTSSVAVISLEPLGRSNRTNVVFGIWPNPKSSSISSMELSIIRANFESFVIQQPIFHVTTSLFGRSYFFQVLKFPGGITIIPPQSAFLLQKVHVLFNFTLTFPIYQVQDKLSELKAQMKSGLLLNSYENLYVSLTNLKGSTVDPLTVVQTSVVLAVGNTPPSVPRLKQLAQKIRSSSQGNLGLNHTVFGRVKQIHLSSFLQHSLKSGGNGISLSPSPAPQSYDDRHSYHHHHHHHHHRHHSDMYFSPAPSPTPTPQRTYKSPAPSGCHAVVPSNHKSLPHIVPAAAPVDSPRHSPSPLSDENLPAPPPVEDIPVPSPVEDPPAPFPNEDQPAPHPNEDPPAPAPAPHLLHRTLPHAVSAHARPPSEVVTGARHPDSMSPISPSPSSSVAGQLSATRWLLVVLLYTLAHLR